MGAEKKKEKEEKKEKKEKKQDKQDKQDKQEKVVMEKKEKKQDKQEKVEKVKKVKKEQDLDRMTVKELRTLAAESTDLVGVHVMKKAELLTAIKEAKGIKEEKAPKEKVERAAITIKQLKAKIVALKEKREEARKEKDKRMVDILRRRINRAKKRTRKLSQA